MRVMIVVTHLLGTGHLSRALTLGRAFADDSHDVMIVSGGMPAPQLNSSGLTMFGLPPLRSYGTNFTRLLTQSGTPADDAYLTARSTALINVVQSFQPHILLTELYPFGRRSLAREFDAMLSTATSLPDRPIILASVRDILAPPGKPAKIRQTEDTIHRCYDGVLVHSVDSVTPLNLSWPVSKTLAPRLHYTGFVAPAPPHPHPQSIGRDEIVVSAGGGSVGQPIFNAALDAARNMSSRRWRLLVGGQDADARMADLRQRAGEAHVTIEKVRPDFRQMLPHVAASVSMCGYNTALDILQSGAPAVFVPFDDGREVEQSLRGQSLSELPAIEVIRNQDLTGSSLSAAIDRVISIGPRAVQHVGFDGARRSVEIAKSLWEQRT
ncbi:MAG: glycosyltransferase [Pseudomonadota bacterium]